MIDPQYIDDLIGKDLKTVQEQLEKDSIRYRIARVDGQPQVLTRDYRTDRLNLTVEQGIVTEIRSG